jgi:uncharacterized protein (DUF1684 family)
MAVREEYQSYRQDLVRWRTGEEEQLRAPDSWLSLLGRFWLKDGVNTLGSHQRSAILLPAAAPSFAGELCVREGAVTVGVAGEHLLLNGAQPHSGPLAPDGSPNPDQLTIGGLLVKLISYGGRLGVRLHDTAHPRRERFAGRHWYPPEPAFRLRATFEPYAHARGISAAGVSGEPIELLCPGALVFTLGERRCRLEAVGGPGGALIVYFRDQTSGADTAAAGRALIVAPPAEGEAELDFNRAANLPSTFSPFADGPLPPAQNLLPLPVTAGELAPLMSSEP